MSGDMKCPYCAEGINAEAIVCRYCNRDLNFFQFFNARLTTLENSVARMQQSAQNAAVVAVKNSGYVQGILTLLRGTACTTLLFCIALWYRHIGANPRSALSSVALLSAPLPFALYLWATAKYTRVTEYFKIGLLQGVVMWCIEMVNAKARWPNDALFTLLKSRISDFLIYVVMSVFLFVTVGLFYEYRRGKNDTEFKRSTAASIIAFNLMGRPKDTQAGSDTEERWKRIAGITSALGPIITLIGTILVAVIGAVAKSAAQAK